tara:strand:+ start:2204 stop:3088 length:885 start_codon:yes stop_codon:yes gene_type:complete
MTKISIIIPTRDRTNLLKKTLLFLKKNNSFYQEIIIVDSSKKKSFDINSKNIKTLTIKANHIFSKPSTSLQRNIGLKKVSKFSDFVMFLDDDVKFEKDALEKMKSFITKNSDFAGYGFNLIIKNQNLSNILKINNLFNFFQLYSNKPGKVAKSGWHSKAINLKKKTLVEWLPTQAVIYKISNIKNIFFFLGFGKYSYLEDLEFSYRVKKTGKLVILNTAKYSSDNSVDRNLFNFGKKEIINRYIFLKKNNLSVSKFLIMCCFICLRNFLKSFVNHNFFLRLCGNLLGLYKISKI